MHDDHSNRMATPAIRRRGPQEPTPLPVKAEEVEIEQPRLVGIRCPGCGRGMIPRRDRVTDGKCYGQCRLCGVRLALTYDGTRPATVRLIR